MQPRETEMAVRSFATPETGKLGASYGSMQGLNKIAKIRVTIPRTTQSLLIIERVQHADLFSGVL